MKALPANWHLVEEWDNNFIFENSNISFCVNVNFTEQCDIQYSIDYNQLKGNYNVIGFENGAYTTNASSKAEALRKAVEMMLFIDKLTKDKSEILQQIQKFILRRSQS
jgi:hypothetical protein